MTVLALDSRESRSVLTDRLQVLRRAVEGLDAAALLGFALRDAFAGRIAVVSSFAAESAVLQANC